MAVRRDAATGGLSLHLLDFLLGCSRSVASIDRLHATGAAYDEFAMFVLNHLSVADFLTLWRQHEAAVRREVRRRSLSLPDPTTYKPFPMGCWVTREWDGD